MKFTQEILFYFYLSFQIKFFQNENKNNNLKVTEKYKKGLSISPQNEKFIYKWKFQWHLKTGFNWYIIDIENLQYILDYF